METSEDSKSWRIWNHCHTRCTEISCCQHFQHFT